MRKVKVTADLEMQSSDGQITIKDRDNDLDVNITSVSAVTFPLQTYLKLNKLAYLTDHLSQKINIIVAGRQIVQVIDGKIYYLKKWWLIKLVLRSIFRKGL